MEILSVRRSGRLSNRRRGNKENDDVVLIDLTTPEWNNASKEFIMDKVAVHGDGGQDTTLEKVDNGEDDMGVEKMDVDKTEKHIVDRALRKAKLDALVDQRRKQKEGERGGLKGKLAALVLKPRKKQNEKASGKRMASKRKKVLLADKVNKKQAAENTIIRDKNAADEIGESDDDFVSNVGERRKKVDEPSMVSVEGGSGKPAKDLKDDTKIDKRTERNPPAKLVSVKGGSGKPAKALKDDNKIDKINARNPPASLFKVMTQLTPRQKKDVIDIGFADILEFKIRRVPTRLAFWLLEQFDENTCSIKLGDRIIPITRDLVRQLLGVPMGEVHLDARDDADHRNELTRQWKAQFGNAKKRHYSTDVAKLIVESGRSGWMFKINFLVLFFSTLGELNLSNTVNLKFLHLLTTDEDILNMDWCTYIIECLIKTKRSWKRDGFYNGPIVLLLVLYGHSETPIKIWSTEMLHKLESDMFYNDDVEDTCVGEEEEYEVHDEEIGLEEDDVNEDYIIEDVPTDYEGLKKCIAELLKKAGKLVDRADQLIEEGLDVDHNDAALLELKELRNEMFAVPTYSAQPKEDTYPDEYANYSFHTPENGGKPFPFTQVYGTPTGYGELSDKVCEEWRRENEQIPTRLDFDDTEEFDLNVTQPPATQGKVVGGLDDGTAMEEGEGEELLESLRNYNSQDPTDADMFRTPVDTGVCEQDNEKHNNTSRFGKESVKNEMKEIVPAYSDPKPLNVIVGNPILSRMKRHTFLPEVLRSPYVVREVSLCSPLTQHEIRVAECLFSAWLPETDILFKNEYGDGTRGELETLYPGIDIASGVINMFTHVLNNAEKKRNKKTPTRLFCHTRMLTSEMATWEYDKASEKFTENMKLVLEGSEYGSLRGVDMIFLPILKGRHFFLVCMNMKDSEVQIFDNICAETIDDVKGRYGGLPGVLVLLFEDYMLHENNPDHGKMRESPRNIMETKCRTKKNYVDCGVFVMRHMETFKGEENGDCCRLSQEGKEQTKELCDLRKKYASKILLSDCNKEKKDFEIEVQRFRPVHEEEKKRLEAKAFKNIKRRAKQFLG